MDTPLKSKKRKLSRMLLYSLGGAALLGLLAWGAMGLNARKLKARKTDLRIATVTHGEFNDYILVQGRVFPFSSIQISALEGGIVQEKLVEEGAMVKKGEVIARLDNPSLSLSILDSEAQLAEKQNFLRNTQVTMEQEKLNLQKELLQLDLDIARKQRRAAQYDTLYRENLCSREEYLQAREEYVFAQKNRELVRERQRQDALYRSIQVEQMEESLRNMGRNLQLVRARAAQLHITSPADGQLGLLDIEVGEMVASGTRIGQVNVLSSYKIEANIDEHYIDRVKEGLSATCKRNDETYTLRVRKVFPEVRNKSFKTEFVFVGQAPKNLRTGQTYAIDLQLGQPSTALLIPRDAFYTSTGGRWIFVLSPDGERAEKREITLGRQNPEFYEVLYGLAEGEQVIVSSYAALGKAEHLIVK